MQSARIVRRVTSSSINVRGLLDSSPTFARPVWITLDGKFDHVFSTPAASKITCRCFTNRYAATWAILMCAYVARASTICENDILLGRLNGQWANSVHPVARTISHWRRQDSDHGLACGIALNS